MLYSPPVPAFIITSRTFILAFRHSPSENLGSILPAIFTLHYFLSTCMKTCVTVRRTHKKGRLRTTRKNHLKSSALHLSSPRKILQPPGTDFFRRHSLLHKFCSSPFLLLSLVLYVSRIIFLFPPDCKTRNMQPDMHLSSKTSRSSRVLSLLTR